MVRARPGGWFDLPNRSRLGWIVGIPVFVAVARALARPWDQLSGFLLLHGGASFAAAVSSGQSGHPNGFRFGYLTTITAVAASAGVLQLVALARPEFRRLAALAAVGLVGVSGVLGARDALLVWPEHRATFDSFHGEDTLLGRAAARWQSFGDVSVEKKLGRSDLTIETVRTYRLDAEPPPSPASIGHRARTFRVARPGAPAGAGERTVETRARPLGPRLGRCPRPPDGRLSLSKPERTAASAAVVAGVASAFVAGVSAVEAIRPGLLVDPEPSWAPYRLVLMLAVALAAAGAGSAAAALLFLGGRTRALTAPLEAWPFGVLSTSALAALALAAGVVLRFVALGRVPEWLWIDDLSLIQPALALQGRLADFSDAVRPVPFGVAKLYGTVGVLYLEGYRLALLLWGTTVFGVRFPSALAGALSLLTGGLLGRALLPRGAEPWPFWRFQGCAGT